MEKINYDVVKSVIDSGNNISKLVWNGIEIEVKQFLTMQEMFEFTNSVFDACFRHEDGEYRPEVKDFMVRSYILDIYTNIEVPDDLESRYEMVYRCDIIPEVMRYIDKTQFNAIMAAIDCKIEDKLSTNVERFEREIEQKMVVIDNMIEEFVGYFNSIFDGIDNETIRQIAGAISNMSIDPAVLAKSVVEARQGNEPKTKETAGETTK